MEIFKIVIAAFAVLGALDYAFGSRLGIGKEFVSGVMLLGTMALTMVGMIILAPGLATLLSPLFDFTADVLHLDPSIIPAIVFANDMGGAPLAAEIMRDEHMGMFNALVTSSMMGATVSFTIPFALGIVPKEKHRPLLLGLLCGIVTIPLGCFVGGLVSGLPILALLYNLLPLILFAALIAFGLVRAPELCVKIFAVLGKLINLAILVGLSLGIVRFLTGFELIKGLGTVEEGMDVCINAAMFLAGAFPLVYVLTRFLGRPLRAFGRVFGINETASVGLLATLASSAPTYGIMKDMDERGAMLNAAFAVSGAWVVAGHLAFTIAFPGGEAFVLPMVLGKLSAALFALLLAALLSGRILAPKKSEIPTQNTVTE